MLNPGLKMHHYVPIRHSGFESKETSLVFFVFHLCRIALMNLIEKTIRHHSVFQGQMVFQDPDKENLNKIKQLFCKSGFSTLPWTQYCSNRVGTYTFQNFIFQQSFIIHMKIAVSYTHLTLPTKRIV